jgi:tRNA(Ile)-lysidine synthase
MASSRKGAPEPEPRSSSGLNAIRGGLEDRVASCLGRHPRAGGRLAVAYSGGLDSAVLLHLLAGLRRKLGHPFGYSLSAVHIHHGLSPNADTWAAHCRRVCAELDIPLTVMRVAVEMAGEGPEAAARSARYREFARLDVDCLALAHHRDDQAETVLLQLLRGGGLKGLAAMPEARWLEGGKMSGQIRLIRPLLEISRSELETWAQIQGLAWIEDESNRQTHLSRNALRHAVLPLIERHFPGAAGILARSAGQFAEKAVLLDELADLDGQEALSPEGLEMKRLVALPEPRARNLLRRYLEQAGATLRQDGLREALRQILEARPDAQVELVFGDVTLRRFHGRVRAIASGEERGGFPASTMGRPSFVWRGEAELALGGSGKLRFERVEAGGIQLGPDAVSIRFRQGGERLRPDARRPRRALKDLLREAAIPPWQRDRMPLLYVGDRLAWVAGIGMDADLLAGPGEPGWRITWTPD